MAVIGKDAFVAVPYVIHQSLGKQAPEAVLAQRIPYEAWPKKTAFVLQSLGVHRWRDLAALSVNSLLKETHFGRARLDGVLRRMAEVGVRFDPSLLRPIRRGLDLSVAGVCGVYVVRCGAFVKIGSASDVRHRLSHVQISVPDDLEVLAVFKTDSRQEAYTLERELHRRFESLWHRGEWFRLSAEIRWYVEAEARKAS